MIVLQPNGFYAVFNPQERDFTRINLTRDEVINFVANNVSNYKGRSLLSEMRRYATKADQAGLARWERAMNDIRQFFPMPVYDYYRSRMTCPQLTYWEVVA